MLIALLCIGVVLTAYASRRDTRALLHPSAILKLLVFIVPVSAVLNAAWSRGGESVLFSLPRNWPLIGGGITLEALAAGALNGLSLTGLIAAFTAFNSALGVRDLVRMTPQAFYPVALVTSIGLTYVPVTLAQARSIREAQAIRGHRLRGLRDWLPLFMPLLIGGLERALQLAEAMTARGFGAQQVARNTTALQLVILAGILTACAGWLLRTLWGQPLAALLVISCGAVSCVLAIWRLSRNSPRTVYRIRRWAATDTLIVVGAALAALGLLLEWPGLDHMSLFYHPYPRLSAPVFDPLQALPLFGLLMPCIRQLGRSDQTGADA